MEDSLRFLSQLCAREFLEDLIHPKKLLNPKNAVEQLRLLDESKDYLKIVIEA